MKNTRPYALVNRCDCIPLSASIPPSSPHAGNLGSRPSAEPAGTPSVNPLSTLSEHSADLKPLRCALADLSSLLLSGAEPKGGEAAEIFGLLRSIEISLLANQIRGALTSARATVKTEPADSWLTADEVATRLKRTRAWVYRQARRWTFAKRPSRKTLLISERGLAHWMEHR